MRCGSVNVVVVVGAILILALATPGVRGEHAFAAHRAAQLSVGAGVRGSTASTLALLATAVDTDATEKLNRRVAVVKLSELTVDMLKSLVEVRRVGGLLVLLPAEGDEVSGWACCVTCDERSRAASLTRFLVGVCMYACAYVLCGIMGRVCSVHLRVRRARPGSRSRVAGHDHPGACVLLAPRHCACYHV